MIRLILIVLAALMFVLASAQQKGKGFEIIERKAKKQVDILYNGKLLTAYCYYDSVRKPFLFPVNTVDGITVTRGFPIASRAGERTDHPHHIGIWMNYESVNGLDFWNNSTVIPVERRHLYGTVRHQNIVTKKAAGQTATLVTTADWLRPDGHVLMKEKITHVFSVKNNDFFVDRISTLTATDSVVLFKDVKDGFFAIRVARELELPSQQADVFVDAQGNPTTVPKISNEGVSGMYYSSEGEKGDSVWSTKGNWTTLTGKKDGKNVTIAIFDHPSNVGYPAYRHARGYGLFAINPFGRKVFSAGKEELNFSLKPGASTTFHYRVLIHSGNNIPLGEMNRLFDDFKK